MPEHRWCGTKKSSRCQTARHRCITPNARETCGGKSVYRKAIRLRRIPDGKFPCREFCAHCNSLFDGLEKILRRITEIVMECNPVTENVALFIFKAENERIKLQGAAKISPFLDLSSGVAIVKVPVSIMGSEEFIGNLKRLGGFRQLLYGKIGQTKKARPASLCSAPCHGGCCWCWCFTVFARTND